jgi:hypothetical protein
MIRNEKVLFPSHEYVFTLCEVPVGEIWLLRLFGKRPPGRKSGPMVHVGLLRCTPSFISGLESVFGPNDFSFEERCQSRMILGETYRCKRRLAIMFYIRDNPRTLYTKIAAEVRFSHIDMFNLYVDVVHLTVRLLCTSEFASGAKIRRGVIRKKLLSVSVKQ